jgi:hypothetical protein
MAGCADLGKRGRLAAMALTKVPAKAVPVLLLIFGILGLAGLIGLLQQNRVWPFNK